MTNEIKTTVIKYCGECLEDFTNGQLVYFAWSENRCFCMKCRNKLDDVIKDFEPRKVEVS